jgi:hypothetical protein
MRAFGRRAVVATILIANGCYGWSTSSRAVPDLVANTDNEPIRVSVVQGRKVPLYHPRLVRDTLFGNPSNTAVRTIKIPLTEVTSVATRSRSVPKTLLLGLAIVGAFITYDLLRADNGYSGL